MSALESIRNTFFEECEDLLEALSEGLSGLAVGEGDDEVVTAVFRAVHSIKGGAGAFGLTDLVGFAHAFETVLDQVRAGNLIVDGELLPLLQKSGDVLSDLVDAAREDLEVDTASVALTVEALEATLGEGSLVEEEFVFDGIEADVDFDLGLAPPNLGALTYQVTFIPDRDLYTIGHEPLNLIKSLADLGDVNVSVISSSLPNFDSFDWEESYLSWEIEILTGSSDEEIKEIFEFAEGCCTLRIGIIEGESASCPASQASDANANCADTEQTHVDDEGDDTSSSAVLPVLAPEPSVQEEPARTSSKPKKKSRATLRVDVDRIDTLINTVGELIINQAMITQRIEKVGVSQSSELAADLEDYKQLARDIQEGVMGLRTQPVRQLFQRMNRIARESADVAGKLARLELYGEETEVDKKVIEKLADPLTHMIRNAIDHGLEAAESRRESEKPEYGVVKLSACYKSGDVLIQISDDGAGLNRSRIRQIAIDRELISEDTDLSDGEIDNLLFRPGFSTAAEVTSLSGRGVGMDVVKTAITSLGGRIWITSTPGKGSTFSILLPLTLAVLDGMVVRIGTETMVVPISCIEEAIRPREADLSQLGAGRLLFSSRGEFIPVVDLAAMFDQPDSRRNITRKTLLLVESNGLRSALAVDSVIDKRQVVIKSLAKNYQCVRSISAATILGDGQVALIVDPDGISEELFSDREESLRSNGVAIEGADNDI